MEPLVDVIIVGAGPAGLATAIAAAKAGVDYQVVEKGVLVNSIFHFPRSMVFFTTPELLEIGGIPFTTPYEKPTRAEALRYYRRVADACLLKIAFGEKVRKITRASEAGPGVPQFRIETQGSDGNIWERFCRSVVLATGYYDQPNLLDIPGENLPHVSHYYTEAHGFYRKRVVVVGGKNSAAEAALDLYRAGAEVTMVHRRGQLGESIKYWIRPDIVNRIREGSIKARFHTRVIKIKQETLVVEAGGKCDELPADAVFLLTGYHPDSELLRQAGVLVDEETCVPQHDPERLETNVPGLYLAGAITAGKETNRIFIENGRLHGETIIQHICTSGIR